MKYIVYKTTNIINNFIYVGVHKTSNPDIFDGYIGNGVYINLPSTYKYSKTAFQIAVNTFGVKNFKRETIATFDEEKEAYLLEGLIVNENFLARADVYNMVLGGEINEARVSKCYQYDNNGYFISEFPSITDAAYSVGKSIQGVSRSIYYRFKCGGYFWSLNKYDKLDLGDYEGSPSSIKIYRYIQATGEYDCEFSSISEAARSVDTTNINITRICKLGGSFKGYCFLYIKANNYADGKTIYVNSRPVYKYDFNGKFLNEYPRQDIAEKLNKGSNISKSIKTKKPCDNGFLWALDKLEVYCSTISNKKPVGKFDLQGNLICTYDSIKKCCTAEGVSKAYIAVGKKYKDYIFKCI